MKRLLLLIMVLSTIGISAQKIEDLPRAAIAAATDLIIIDQADATRSITVATLLVGPPAPWVGLFPDGTAGAPGAAFWGDLDVGMWRPGDDILGFTAGGIESYRATEVGGAITNTFTNDVVITDLASANTLVLTPTAAGLIDTLETEDVTEITLDTLDVDYLEVNSELLVNEVIDTLKVNGAGILSIHETTTPAAVDDYGKIYTKSDNNLYFQDGAGNEKELGITDTHYGEMFMYESTGVETIGQTDQYYGVSGEFEVGDVENFSFVAGQADDGTATITDNGSSKVKVTETGHTLSDGDYVTLQSANHSGTSIVSGVAGNDFELVAIAYSGDEGCTWQEGDYLLAGVGSAGMYLITVAFTGSAGAAAKNYKFEAVQNATHIDKSAFEITTSGTNHQSGASSGIITISDVDRIWFQFKNETDTQDLNYEHGNINLIRL